MNVRALTITVCGFLTMATIASAQPLRRIGVDRVRGQASAVVVTDRSLLHTSQLFPFAESRSSANGGLEDQLAQLRKNFDRVLQHRGADRRQVVKVNFYVTDTDVAVFLRTRLAEWFGPASLPAVSFVQSRLPYEEADMAMDAVVAVAPLQADVPPTVKLNGIDARKFQTTYSVLPRGDAVYIAGQAERGELGTATAATLQGLARTLKHLELRLEHVVQLKCYLQPMRQIETVDEQIAAFFGQRPVPPVSHVEWISGGLPIEIELVAYAPAAQATDSIRIETPPWMPASPVFSRVTRLHGDRQIYLSSLQRSDGQVSSLFNQMQTTLAATGSDLRHLAKATYYVTTDEVSRQLNEIRPTVFDPARPPAASKARVHGVAAAQRTISVDMIASPNRILTLPRSPVTTNVVADSSSRDFKKFRRMITGPDVNEHPPYKGCTGFVGWESVTRLQNGDLLCSFSAGYWHVSFPSPIDVEPKLLKSYQSNGFPLTVDAPTGGRALICRSTDQGRTWSQPSTLIDTPGDDRHPVIVEHPDGTLVCIFFVIDNWYGYDRPPTGRNKNSRVASSYSTDGGKTWSTPTYMPSPLRYYDRMCGKPVLLPNGDLVLSTYGKDHWRGAEQLAVYRSHDSGRSWKFISRLHGSVGALDEPALTKAAHGGLVMISRPNGEIAFSHDDGQRWTSPRPFGIKMVAPCLLTQSDGTIVCIFGWGATGGLQMMWSDDHGKTWTVPAKDRGFTVDNSVYVYGIGTELDDGSIYVVYYDPAGKQRKTAIWGLRLRIKKDRRGIEFLPLN